MKPEPFHIEPMAAPAYRIRELKAQDLKSFIDLMLLAHADDLELFGVDRERSAAQMRSMLSNPIFRWVQAIGKITRRFLVAESDGKVVGSVGLTGQKVLEVVGTAVHPDYRGQGLGRALMQAIVAEAQKLGRDRVILNVREDNRPAVNIYEHAGFHVYQRLICALLDLPFDRPAFATRESAYVRDYQPSDGEPLSALGKLMLSEEYFEVTPSLRSRYEPALFRRILARLLSHKSRRLVWVLNNRAIGFISVRADARLSVGVLEDLLIEDQHVLHLPVLLRAGLEFLEGAGKCRALLSLPAERAALTQQIERLGFRKELTALRMVRKF